MGVGLSACIPPMAGRASFELNAGEIELGLGIHGEPGIRREPLQQADKLVDLMLSAVVLDLKPLPGQPVALLVNGLGGTPAIELGIVARAAMSWLSAREIVVERTLCGNFLTSLEMAGCSVSLMTLDELRLARLDAAGSAPAWPSALGRPRERRTPNLSSAKVPCEVTPPYRRQGPDFPNLREGILAVVRSLINEQDRLTEMDRVVGDGDLGISLARGAEAITHDIEQYHLTDVSATFRAIAGSMRRAIGGSSGPLYAIGLMRFAAALEQGDICRPLTWAKALDEACKGVSELGGAVLGDCTMLDALIPAANSLLQSLSQGATRAQALEAAVHAAQLGAQSTAGLVARRGRSSYIGDRALGHVDPGAEAVCVWLSAIQGAFQVK